MRNFVDYFEGFFFEKGDLFSRNLLFRELRENFSRKILFTSRSFCICGKNFVRISNIEFLFLYKSIYHIFDKNQILIISN